MRIHPGSAGAGAKHEWIMNQKRVLGEGATWANGDGWPGTCVLRDAGQTCRCHGAQSTQLPCHRRRTELYFAVAARNFCVATTQRLDADMQGQIRESRTCQIVPIVPTSRVGVVTAATGEPQCSSVAWCHSLGTYPRRRHTPAPAAQGVIDGREHIASWGGSSWNK